MDNVGAILRRDGGDGRSLITTCRRGFYILHVCRVKADLTVAGWKSPTRATVSSQAMTTRQYPAAYQTAGILCIPSSDTAGGSHQKPAV